ncbi:conserved hypothetical protein [Azospirillaceae bacterium]
MSKPASRANGPLELVEDGVRVAVRVSPRSSRTAVTGMAMTPDGGKVLKVAVTAVAEAGKANDAVIRFLAKTWRVSRSSLSIVSGATDRNKKLHIAGDPEALFLRLAALFPPEICDAKNAAKNANDD